jgi:DNA repair exonuclease SbcCD ATPase subunit
MVKPLNAIEQKIREVRKSLENARARIPKHDIPPALMAEIDELEEELTRLQAAAVAPASIDTQIKEVEIQLANATARLPKHDIPSALMAEIDELEEELTRLHALRDAGS